MGPAYLASAAECCTWVKHATTEFSMRNTDTKISHLTCRRHLILSPGAMMVVEKTPATPPARNNCGYLREAQVFTLLISLILIQDRQKQQSRLTIEYHLAYPAVWLYPRWNQRSWRQRSGRRPQEELPCLCRSPVDPANITHISMEYMHHSQWEELSIGYFNHG